MTRRSIVRLGLGTLGCVVLLVLWIAYFMFAPLRFSGDIRDVAIERGSSLRMVARKLHAAGILPDAIRFELLARAMNKASSLKAGNYRIEAYWSALQLLDALSGTAFRLDKVALVEGWTFRQVRGALNAHDGLKHDTRAMTDEAILDTLKISQRHPEGLFFPDTYYFAKGTSDTSVLSRAAARMQQMLAQLWSARIVELPIEDPYRALIVASIIEKETGRDADRPLVAAVIINRLRKGMRLQLDPTVIYGLGEAFDGNLRRRDLEADGPYNTYTRNGLPPTPIAMPGLASLTAALTPADTSALYFVARGDGSSHFSESLAEHNRAVTKYQRQQTREK